MITRLEVDGFKSLRVFALDFEPFTALIGPNGAGKSNVLDVLSLLARLASGDLATALQGGRGEIREQFASLFASLDDEAEQRGHGPLGVLDLAVVVRDGIGPRCTRARTIAPADAGARGERTVVSRGEIERVLATATVPPAEGGP